MFTNNLKTWIGIAVGLITIIGAIWLVGNTFATNDRVDKVEVITEKNINTKIEAFEVEVAGALQNQQIKSDYQFYQFLYDRLTQEMLETKRQLRRDPNDQLLRQDYVDKKEEREKLKEKMDKLMDKVN